MKRLIASMFLLVLCSISARPAEFNPETYTETEATVVKATPEELKNKKICFTTSFIRYLTAFPTYIESSGFKPSKYYLIEVLPHNFPIMAKKDQEISDILIKIAPKTQAKVYGKVKKYKIEPKAKILPRYFLELDKLEVLNEKVQINIDDEEENQEVDKPGMQGQTPAKIKTGRK